MVFLVSHFCCCVFIGNPDFFSFVFSVYDFAIKTLLIFRFFCSTCTFAFPFYNCHHFCHFHDRCLIQPGIIHDKQNCQQIQHTCHTIKSSFFVFHQISANLFPVFLHDPSFLFLFFYLHIRICDPAIQSLIIWFFICLERSLNDNFCFLFRIIFIRQMQHNSLIHNHLPDNGMENDRQTAVFSVTRPQQLPST